MWKFLLLLCVTAIEAQNDRPIIGILSQRVPQILVDQGITGTYIASSYVKWVESAGARAVPIIVNGDQDAAMLMQSINGLLIPGGAVSLNDSDYASYGHFMTAMAMNMNDFGDYFPVWGTCLGFELLAFFSNNFERNLARCEGNDIALPLEFTEDLPKSRIFEKADADILDILSTQSVTSNFHHWCLTPENFTRFEMGDFWNVISVNSDSNGMEFISTMEAKNYPIYGVQFHPEKNNYEWAPSRASIPHSSEAILVSNYMAEFFVDEARKSLHTFDSREAEEAELIYNYSPIYVGKKSIDFGFQQLYVFPDK